MSISKYAGPVYTSPDNKYVVLQAGSTLQIYDQKTLALIKTLFGDVVTTINYVRFNRDGSILGVNTNDSTFIFDMKILKLLGSFNFNQCLNSFDFYNNKNFIIIGYSKSTESLGHFWAVDISNMKNVFSIFHFVYRAGGFLNMSISEKYIVSYGYPASIFLFKNPLLTLIQEQIKIDDLLYPNPTKDYIEILTTQLSESFKLSESYTYSIYNVFGLKLPTSLTSSAAPQEGNLKIDVSGLPTGVYFVRIGDKVMKFLKM